MQEPQVPASFSIHKTSTERSVKIAKDQEVQHEKPVYATRQPEIKRIYKSTF